MSDAYDHAARFAELQYGTSVDATKLRARSNGAESATVTKLDWKAQLRRRGDRIVGDELNVMTALQIAPDLAGLVRFNEFQGRVEFARPAPWRSAGVGEPWTDSDDLDLHAYLQRHEIDPRARSIVADVVERVARDLPHHPVRAYLDGLVWDGTARLGLWLRAFLGAIDPPEYLAAIGTKFMTSAVARVYSPGCKVDHALVLEGRQGIGKTRVVHALGSPWTTDNVPEFAGADAAMQLAGVWLVELAELAAMRRSEIETVKAFLTRTEDHYRPPYGRRPVRVPRQCVFIGTTNEEAYLRDPTGNRRFWPVRCTEIDHAELADVRHQLWAEARTHYLAGREWHLTPSETALAAAEQAERQLITELEHAVHEYLDALKQSGVREITTREVLAKACHLEPLAADYMQRAGQLGPQVAHAMSSAGWQRVGSRGRGVRRRIVYRCS